MEKTSRTQTSLSAYNNSWYRPGSFPKQMAWYMANRLFLNTYLPWPMIVKVFILKLFGAEIGTGIVIKPKVNIKYPWFLSIGNNCWIGENVWIDNLTMVTMEANVCLSQGSMLLTGNHDYTKSTFDLIIKPITLESGAWIGAKATVCPGAKVGSHAVLTVNSVASGDLEPYGIYQGNPAKYLKTRNLTH
ncbi:WcaF family extracellular polysaccharide biosynthesis acetyltransferase [Dyadobacter sediminis]|uniref:Colanic acid biosynthesis acetyltransferase WcaF n=1 Tax=Dyadobacter sediminis TaxID=1493691 RepID=A0A5R9KFT0_9BACT|nr:WcaF family extracellular polysaccharide biosynthesis acetyltransferase [Dyadobacter sediminis]TLU94959.1 colanic acid biosynthesis acetyltransferase WcaF [Dyadobacter sediminis]GGB86533.1 colanic acid biosynthesis acetyltransferase WcaF [Dyadobacter sediminis]